MKVTVSRKSVKNLTIRVVDANNIAVTAPIDMSNNTIKQFLITKQGWIERKIKEKSIIYKEHSDIINSQTVLINGESLQLKKGDVPNVCCINNSIILPNKKVEDVVSVQKEVDKYILHTAKNALPKLVAFWGTKMSLCPTAIKVKKLKSKWGSCNGDGEIVLNSKLLHLPQALAEYVVVHELCHLKNLNHSDDFWQNVEYYLPNYAELRKSLKKYDFLTTI